jgi:hypothetical protein
MCSFRTWSGTRSILTEGFRGCPKSFQENAVRMQLRLYCFLSNPFPFVIHLSYRIHRFFLDFFHRPVFQKTRRFGNWICLRHQMKVGEKTPIQLGPLERANLNHWANPGLWKTPYKHPTTNFVSKR